MRDAPTYAQAIQEGYSGDDPLGLASTNERLYSSALPGINNVVRYIRVYSAICWMTHQVTETLKKNGVKTDGDATRLFKAAIEKIELALVWVNSDRPDLAGKSREFPANDKLIRLQFKTFGEVRATLFDATYYKPSLTNGLRFLEQRTGRTYGCLPNGEALANAFDKTARQFPYYEWLKAPGNLNGRRSQVKALAPALDVSKPSADEQSAFLASFFPSILDKTATNDDKVRWLTLCLVLRSVRATCDANRKAEIRRNTASPSEIRACMARGIATDGSSVVTPDLKQVQAWWAVLQVRQLQRLCLETLFCVAERWIAVQEIEGGSQALDACLDELSASARGYLKKQVQDTVGQMEKFFGNRQHGNKSLYEAAGHWRPTSSRNLNNADVFLHTDSLLSIKCFDLDDSKYSEAVAHAYKGLVFCAVETLNLASNTEARKAMDADKDTCSLLRLAELVKLFHAGSIEAFLRQVFKEWVIQRHFAIATSRSVAFDGKNRFRFVLGDYGLERCDRLASPPEAKLSADRLNHALMLCEQSGLLITKAGRYKLTPHGRARLKE